MRDEDSHADLTSIQGDIRDAELLARTFAEHKFEAVFHCAAMLAHDVKDDDLLWTSNVDGTRLVAEAALAAGVTKVVNISSNCLWGENLGHVVAEDETPAPVHARQQLLGLDPGHAEPLHRAVKIRCNHFR